MIVKKLILLMVAIGFLGCSPRDKNEIPVTKPKVVDARPTTSAPAAMLAQTRPAATQPVAASQPVSVAPVALAASRPATQPVLVAVAPASQPAPAVKTETEPSAPPDRGVFGLVGEPVQVLSIRTQPIKPVAPTGTPKVAPVPLTDLAPGGEPSAPAAPTRSADSPAPPISVLQPSRTDVVSSLLIQVNNLFISSDDILRELHPKILAIPKGIRDASFREAVARLARDEIRSQISEALVYAEADRRMGEQEKKQIDEEIAETLRDMIQRSDGSRVKLEADLAHYGMNLDDVMRSHRRRIVVSMYLRQRFHPSVRVNREALLAYYNSHLSDYASSHRVQMQTIASLFSAFLPEMGLEPTAPERDAAKAKAKENILKAADALKAGEEFGEVAKKYSKDIKSENGGLWPIMTQGSFKEAKVEDVAFLQIEGQASGILETESGYYIVKTVKAEAAKMVKFEDAQDKIEESMRQEQYRKMTDEYFNKLYQAATISQPEGFLSVVADKAVERYRQK